MTRVKRGSIARHRHKKVLKRAKGFRGAIHRLYRPAHQAVIHSNLYATRDRRTRKRDFRSLWITRIGIATRAAGLPYNRFMAGLKKAHVALDRKSLAELAVSDAKAFGDLVQLAQAA